MRDVNTYMSQAVAAYLSEESLSPGTTSELIRFAMWIDQNSERIADFLENADEEYIEPNKVLTDQIRHSPREIRDSVTPEYIYSFEDGKPYKTLKAHLTRLGMTFEEYKAKHGLPADYPKTAERYSKRRSEMARTMGLGQTIHRPKVNQGRRGAPFGNQNARGSRQR